MSLSKSKLLYSLALICMANADGKAAPPPLAKYKPQETPKIEVPPIPFCPDGTPFTDSGCVSSEFSGPSHHCPHPYKLDKKNNQCITKQIGKSTATCPKGSFLHGHHCVTEVSVPPQMYCKNKHAELVKDQCIVQAETEVTKDEYSEIILSCPKHYKLENDVCVKEIKMQGEPSCPKGYFFEKGKCVQYETAPFECAKGYTPVADGCLSMEVVSAIPHCPKHTKADGKGGCISGIETPPTMVCEKGYQLNEKKKKCEARILLQAIPIESKKEMSIDVHCKKGEKDEKGNCYQIHYTKPVGICDNGTQMVKHKCLLLTPVSPDFICPKKYEMTKAGECVKANVAKPVCPEGFKLHKNQCIRSMHVHPTMICPKGDIHKKKCVTYDTETPIAQCKKGFELEKGVCIKRAFAKAGKDKTYPVSFKCAKGYKLDKHSGECVKFMKGPAEVVCEKGFEFSGKKCIAYHMINPDEACPKSYTSTGKGCERTTFTRPIFKCPEGSFDHGKKCYIYAQDDKKQ